MEIIMEKRKSRLNVTGILSVIFAITTIIGIAACLFILKDRHFYTSEKLAAVRQNTSKDTINKIENRLGQGESMTSILRDIDPDKMVYVSGGTYIFADINHSLKKNTFSNGTFTKDANNQITYSEDGKVVSHKVIDVSRYQNSIDFAKVKSAGVDYAMLRCGYRSYGEGILTEDTSFNTNAAEAIKNNIKIGAYFFSQAINTTEAREEADYVINMVKPYQISGPIAIDIEEIFDDTYRQMHLTPAQLTDVIITFCDRIKEAGYTPMIYSNLSSFIGNVELERLENYEKWFAYYSDEPYFPYEISMWQYTDNGVIDGISRNVDLNISFKEWK